jgi:hypothetical protein
MLPIADRSGAAIAIEARQLDLGQQALAASPYMI